MLLDSVAKPLSQFAELSISTWNVPCYSVAAAAITHLWNDKAGSAKVLEKKAFYSY